MDKQENIMIRNGETDLVDNDGIKLFTIELTPNMIVLLDQNGTPIIRKWRKIEDMIVNWSKLNG